MGILGGTGLRVEVESAGSGQTTVDVDDNDVDGYAGSASGSSFQ